MGEDPFSEKLHDYKLWRIQFREVFWNFYEESFFSWLSSKNHALEKSNNYMEL